MTTATTNPSDLASTVLRSMLAGDAPNGIRAIDCGPWCAVIESVYSAYDRGGSEAARNSIQATAKVDRNVAALIAGQAPKQTVIGLPSEAMEIYRHEAPCGHWLDDYVAYASQVAPTMVPEFHQLAGLFAVSTALARRLCLHYTAGTLYPNIYGLFVAPSGYGKTTAWGALSTLIRSAGLEHLMLTEQMTPENLLAQMSMNVPNTLGQWQQAAQDLWLRERAFAAQRGWMIDEAAFMFDSLAREYMTGLMGLLLRFYDCPPEASRETQSGGRVVLKNISLSFLGASTTSNMRTHFQNEKWWSDGLWGRYAIVLPSRDPVWVDDAEGNPIAIPGDLVRRLRHIYTMFGEPKAELVEDEKKRQSVDITDPAGTTGVRHAPGVYASWQIYRKAVAFTIGTNPGLDEPLRGSYARFPTLAMKVAMLLAAMDSETADVVITMPHYARAQRIAETWRASMHQVWSQEIRIDERQVGDRVMGKLRYASAAGLTSRELQQQLNRPAREINDVLTLLQDGGLVESTKQGKKVVWKAL